MRPGIARIEFRDDFSAEHGAGAGFDAGHWKVLQGKLKSERGYAVQEASRSPPRGPGEMTFALFGTVKRHLNRSLVGTNGVEVTLVDYLHEMDYPREKETGLLRGHVMGWGVTVGSWHGQMGGQNDHRRDRGVQLHFDLMVGRGLYVSLVRGIVEGDWRKFPSDGLFLDTALAQGAVSRKVLGSIDHREWSLDVTDELMKKGSFISYPCLVLACRAYPAELDLHKNGNRFGLFTTNDGKGVRWTLNGEVIDDCDIDGYFASSPGSVAEGALLTLGGAGCFQTNGWVIDDVTLYAS